MNNFWLKLNTWRRLGLKNIAVVASYRVAKHIGYYRYRFPVGTPLDGSFLSVSADEASDCVPLSYFSYHNQRVSSPPDWFVNPWNKTRYDAPDRHWTEIPDFIPELGDIKTVWEASRFDWLPRMAWEYRCGNNAALGRLELWLRDWALRNPVNGGINWKCGQEASLRCLNLLVAALAIDECFDKPRPGFLQFLEIHLKRIFPTLRYAMAQNNNHGISEAAALFIVGHYLTLHGNKKQRRHGEKWTYNGHYWLENRVKNLIMADGSFSQQSVTYHRLMLDVLSLTELLRSRFRVAEFSAAYYAHVKLAVSWLHRMTDSRSVDAPNLGANDGACLFNLEEASYRDFRPSIQLGAAVFLKQAAWAVEVKHPLLKLFAVDIRELPPLEDSASSLMAEGGYACLKYDAGFAMLRLPVYRFRPSHADALHLDVWHNGVNWIRDAGTYSYNADKKSLDYFPGTGSHSTACFDKRDQMPCLGRFLFGAWLKPDVIEFDVENGSMKSGYTDYQGARHIREVRRQQDGWRVIDELSGFDNEAVLRWRLAPWDWELDGMCLRCDALQLTVAADSEVVLSLIELPESLYYFEQHLIPVLEMRCLSPGKVVTTILFDFDG